MLWPIRRGDAVAVVDTVMVVVPCSRPRGGDETKEVAVASVVIFVGAQESCNPEVCEPFVPGMVHRNSVTRKSVNHSCREWSFSGARSSSVGAKAKETTTALLGLLFIL